MAGVVTQIDIMKYAGMDKAVFPGGTIVTPSAKDWAADHNVRIIIGENSEDTGGSNNTGINGIEKAELLKHTIKAVIANSNKAGGLLKKNEIVETVIACLKKLGCIVEK
jgi:hypothetical protein